MSTASRVADKAGVIGAIVGSFSCPLCFPAAASIGAAIGLGFLGQWEGLFVHTLIPIFAFIALLANLVGWVAHRSAWRLLAGVAGPLLVLLGAFGLMGVFRLTHGFLPAPLARGVFYAGLIVMIASAVWDLARPASRRCRVVAAARNR
ncbi:MAG TPA: organomercurial transporter MerC [Rhodanobacteraceae bacterium]